MKRSLSLLLFAWVLTGVELPGEPPCVPGDVNQDGAVTSSDSLLINQVIAGTREAVVTAIEPNTRYDCQVLTAKVWGTGFRASHASQPLTIGPPVNVTLTNVVYVRRELLTAVIPAGGGLGVGKVTLGTVTSYARLTNEVCTYSILPQGQSAPVAGGTFTV